MLRLWSVKRATDGDVSDLYVQIGNDLNLTIGAFAQHQIDLRYVGYHETHSFILLSVSSFGFFGFVFFLVLNTISFSFPPPPPLSSVISIQYRRIYALCLNVVFLKSHHQRFWRRLCRRSDRCCLIYLEACRNDRRVGRWRQSVFIIPAICNNNWLSIPSPRPPRHTRDTHKCIILCSSALFPSVVAFFLRRAFSPKRYCSLLSVSLYIA